MIRSVRGLYRSSSGAVAPTVALSLFALIAAGGIAFDYARLASLDTELQNAADQAALAAAGQLDGQSGACARAAAAAAGLLANETLFANDGDAAGLAITIQNDPSCANTGSSSDPIQFYQSYDQTNDTFGPAATSDANARVVLVRVDPRQAIYALTPIVGAFSSGPIAAEAVASLGSSICKVPPVMMCNPAEPDGNSDVNFDFNPSAGAGLRLVIDAPDAPGNFGFLRVDAAGALEVAKQLGYDNPPIGCFATNGVETQPGDMQAVRAAFNTRFDIYESGNTTCPANGVCSPSINSRKDLVRSTSCGLSTNTSSTDWHEALIPYRAPNTMPLSGANPMDGTNTYPEVMGFPRDLCHAVSVTGVCQPLTGNAIVGTGAWDIDAYFQVNYTWDRPTWMLNVTDENNVRLAMSDADVPSVSRYDVYKWEIRNRATLPLQQTVSGPFTASATPVCGSGIVPSPSTVDRRKLTVAVVNCEAQNLRGHRTDVQVRKWLDVFLVEPALARGNGPSQRTTNGDIYVEVIDVATSGSGSTDSLPTRRDVPYLIR